MSQSEQPEMNFMQHLAELRKRLFYALLAVILGSILAYNYSDLTFDLLTAPYYQGFTEQIMIGTGPAEAFLLKIKTAVFVGFLLVLPIIFYQFWQFVAPGLYPQEKKYVSPFVITATLLFLIGVYFCYQAVLPIAFEFFAKQYESIGITPTVRVSEHIAIVMKIMLGFGLVFELPVVSFFLAKVGILSSEIMRKSWKIVIVFAFILSAILTPPDIVSQFLMALPLVVLYAVSIQIVKFVEKK